MSEVFEVVGYSTTNSYLVVGDSGALLLDTGMAPTLRRFLDALKDLDFPASAITHAMATHYHPDHIGLLPVLASYGVEVVAFGDQCGHIHDSDDIYARDEHSAFSPLDDACVRCVGFDESRGFLAGLGISGEVVSLPSHCPGSVGLLLDDGCAFVGDLLPLDCVDFDVTEVGICRDWNVVLKSRPHTVYYGHAPKRRIGQSRFQDGIICRRERDLLKTLIY